MQPLGLAHVPTPRLQALLRAVRSGAVAVPLTPQNMMLAGFSDLFDQVDVLAGLDAGGIHAAIVVAIAERKAAEEREKRRR